MRGRPGPPALSASRRSPSIDDLHTVVRSLRNPEAFPSSGTGLSELSALINGALRDGTDVRSQILVSDPATCDPRVAHAAYRLVQESVSNAQRHAPGASLFLDVRGGPEVGLTLRATNWVVPGGHTPLNLGGGHGLTGMSERVALVGGTFQAGPTAEGAFAVVAWLPWAPRVVVPPR